MHRAEKPVETVHPSTVHCAQAEEPGQGWVSLQKDPRTGLSWKPMQKARKADPAEGLTGERSRGPRGSPEGAGRAAGDPVQVGASAGLEGGDRTPRMGSKGGEEPLWKQGWG